MTYAIHIVTHLLFSYIIPITPVLLGTYWMRQGNPGWRQTLGGVLTGTAVIVGGLMYHTLYSDAFQTMEISNLVALVFSHGLYMATALWALIMVMRTPAKARS